MKVIRTLLIGGYLVLGAASVQAQSFWNKLYVYYPFNGNTLDAAGSGLNATGTNVSPAEGKFGEPIGSYYFNGVDSKIVRNVLVLPDSTTICGWFYSESDSLSSPLLYNGNIGNSGSGINLRQSPALGPGVYGKKLTYLQGGVSESYFNSAFSLPKNEWTHLALVRKGASFNFFINGAYRASGFVNFNPPVGEFSVGGSTANIGVGYGSFKGRVDEVMVFRTVLTASEMLIVSQTNLTENKPAITDEAGIYITPNPSENRIISINCRKVNVNAIEIFDSKGSCVKTFLGGQGPSDHTNQYDLSDLSPGLYTTRVKTDGKSFSKRILLK